jgi:hypothetical protein
MVHYFSFQASGLVRYVEISQHCKTIIFTEFYFPLRDPDLLDPNTYISYLAVNLRT